jgi:two-component system, OmpR family, sensor kinase
MLSSLFWKIFAAFMTANVLAMVSAAYYLMPTDESKEFNEVRKEFALNMATIIIARIESGQSVDLFRSDLTGPMRGRGSFIKEILIIDDQNIIIFGEQNLYKNQQHSFIDYQSDSGRQYRIGTDISGKPSIFEYLFMPRQTVRFIILFFSTIVASFILSLLIIQPLKKLRKHAQNLSDGNMQSRVEKNLLKRNDEIGDLSRELDEMANTLDSLINSKQQLLHDVSHELRAPLGRLQAIAAIMQQQPDNSNQKMVKRIERECVRMNELIQEILEYSRMHYDLESRRIPSQVNLSALFRKLVKGIQHEYPSHPIQLNYFDEQLNITGHANRLNRAFENILRNACKHTPEKTSIDISAQQINKHIEIQIRDHGLGVDEEDLAELTMPFFRADGAKHTVGYGLGLSISQRIIRHHQGVMNISNHLQGGLLISVIFPAVK